MVDSVKKPGVEITQKIVTPAVTSSSPNLVPCIVGPAFEVITLLDDNNVTTQESRLKDTQGNDIAYKQIPLAVETIDFPTAKADPSQMSVLADEVQVALTSGKTTNILSVRPSSAFLAYGNFSYRAGIFLKAPPANFKVKFNVAVDVIRGTSVTSDKLLDISINIASLEALVSAINEEMGFQFAYKVTIGNTTGLLLISQRYGVSSSITLRYQSGAITANHATWGLANKTYRVEGSGFKTQDEDANNVTTSSYIVYSRGKFFLADNISSIDGNDDTYNDQGQMFPVWVNGEVTEDTNFETSRPLDVTFVEGQTQRNIPLKGATRIANGDLFFANGPFGSSVSGVQVSQVEANRFKLVTVDTINSIYGARGEIVEQRYLDFKLGELTSPTPFAPKNVFFRAQNITELDQKSQYASIKSEINTNLQGYVAPAGGSVSLSLVNLPPILGADGLQLKLRVINSEIAFDEFVFTAGPEYANIGALATAINDSLVQNLVSFFTVSAVGNNTLKIETVFKGANIYLEVRGSILSLFSNGADPYLETDIITDNGNDEIIPALTGKTLSIYFNGNDKPIDIVATSNSLDSFIARINEIVGSVVATIVVENDIRYLNIRSYLKGMAGSIRIADSTPLNIVNTTSYGLGRPDPDVLVFSDGSILLGSEVLRNSITGQPLKSVRASVNISYRALRLDLSPIANEPGLIKVSSISDLDSIYGPISIKNPLALGIYYALLNSGSGVEISAIGISDISGSEPNGTANAYIEACEFLRSYEVYAIAALTDSETVIEILDSHVKDMSLPANKRERIVITAPKNPERFLPTVVLSGETAESTGNEDQIDLNTTPEATLASLGISTDGTIPFQLQDGKQLFISLKFGDIATNYSVMSVDGSRVALRRSLTVSQNSDGFFSTQPLPQTFVGVTFSLQLRGKNLTLPGSTKLDKTSFAETVRDKAQQYANRRQLRLYPQTVQTVLNGVELRVSSFFFASALAGACASVAPQEPFTRRKILGFTNTFGPSLETSHLDIISAGNAVIETESVGETPVLRMQGTTDPSSIETREWSITRAVDYFSKTLRNALRKRIGLFNITQAYVDDLSTLLDGACVSATERGLFLSASVTKLVQDKLQPDTLLVEIQVEVFYPANYIKLTIAI